MQSNTVDRKDMRDSNSIQPPAKSTDTELNKMRWALTSITKEIKRFYYSENNEGEQLQDFELLNKIFKYKLRIKMKKKQIKRLNQNFKICYMKLLISSKEKDSWNLTKSFLIERRKQDDLIKNHFIKVELVRKLSKENVCLEKMFNSIQNYIYKVYNDLPNNSIETLYDCEAPLLEKIKSIFFHYEQQNIFFSNERARCQLIEQKNTFLKNKINILECNIESLKEEIANLTYQLLKRDREVVFYKSKLFNKINQTEASVGNSSEITTPNKSSNLQHNLSSHLALVNSLLIDQESMIDNLKKIPDLIYSMN